MSCSFNLGDLSITYFHYLRSVVIYSMIEAKQTGIPLERLKSFRDIQITLSDSEYKSLSYFNPVNRNEHIKRIINMLLKTHILSLENVVSELI